MMHCNNESIDGFAGVREKRIMYTLLLFLVVFTNGYGLDVKDTKDAKEELVISSTTRRQLFRIIP
jgi:hypothetical protein